MKVDLGALIPALRDWTLCIDEPTCECVICIELPEWAEELGERERVYLALYIASRRLLDYRLAAAMHIYMVKNRVALKPEILLRGFRESRTTSKVPRAVEDEGPYVWEAVLYKGILYAQGILSLDKPVIVKVEPPRDKRGREKLRVLLEGKRVTVKGKTYHVGGLIKELGGRRIAPWTYLVPKRNLPRLLGQVPRARVSILAPS